MRYAVAATLLSIMVGCASNPASKNPQTADEVAAGCKRTHDKFINLEGATSPAYWFPDTSLFYFMAFKTSPDKVRLIFSWVGEDWRFFDRAYAVGGQSFDFSSSDRKVLGPRRVNEVMHIALPKADLEAVKDGPFELKFVGKRGSYVLQIPAYFIQGYLGWLGREPV